MTHRDYYEILGIPRNASLEEIRKAYREQALRYHPDRVPTAEKKASEEKFKEISEAYAVLSDPQKRTLYDQRGHEGINQTYTNQDFYNETDFESVFSGMSDHGFDESLFERIFRDFGVFGERGRSVRQRGQDLQMNLDITLEDAYYGLERPLSLSYDGKQKHIKVSIPPGVKTGSQLRLKGQGEEGGDLFIVVSIKEHPLFKRIGDDLHIESRISIPQAILGGEIEVPTLFSKVHMKIPPGTQNGTKFRLKGKGMPHLVDKNSYGDEIVSVTVTIPASLTAEQKRLIEALARTDLR